LFSSCLYLCSIVCICACVFLLFVPLFHCFYMCVCFPLVRNNRTKVHIRGNRRTDKNNWTKVHTRGKKMYRYKQLNKSTIKKKKHTQMKTIYEPLFNCFYLCVCLLLVCTFVQLFLFVRVFSSRMNICSFVFIAQIKTIEQRYIQEENTRTDKNNWTKVHTRGNHTHR
jgi:hypothetical protein